LLNSVPKVSNKVILRYDKKLKIVVVELISSDLQYVKLAPRLALQLGFFPDTDITKVDFSNFPALLLNGLPGQIFVYCDIVENVIVGDTSAPLLRIVSLDKDKHSFGTTETIKFENPHYIKLMKKSFDNLEIDLRDETGKQIPFATGTSIVKLHFRRSL
jgi:hypothetical protein